MVKLRPQSLYVTTNTSMLNVKNQKDILLIKYLSYILLVLTFCIDMYFAKPKD